MTTPFTPHLAPIVHILRQATPLPGIHNRRRLIGRSLIGGPFLLVGLGITAGALHELALGDKILGPFLLCPGVILMLMDYGLSIWQGPCTAVIARLPKMQAAL